MSGDAEPISDDEMFLDGVGVVALSPQRKVQHVCVVDGTDLEALDLAGEDGQYGHNKYNSYDNALVLSFPPLPLDPKASEKERVKRRRYKEKLGAKYPETLLLDTKIGHNGQSQFCDAIFITATMSQWIQALTTFYQDQGYTKEEKGLNGGLQHTWANQGKNFISINFYLARNKIMVQPGDKKRRQPSHFH